MTNTPATQERPAITLRDVLAALWESLQSTRTTLYLLMVIAAAGLIGILVPQGQPPEVYLGKYGQFFGSLFLRLGFTQVFSSFWFLFMLGLLLASTAACARRIWRLGRDLCAGPSTPFLQGRLRGEKTEGLTETLPGAMDEVQEQFTQRLRRHWYGVEVVADGDAGRMLVGRKHRWGGWGIVLSHVALFAIALGALIGRLPTLAMEKNISIAEGETYHDKSLPFDLRLNKFSLEYYKDGHSVKAYKSNLSVLEGKAETKRETIRVNKPLSHAMINFYQSYWGLAGFRVRITDAAGKAETLTFPLEMQQDEDGNEMYAVSSSMEGSVQFAFARKVAVMAQYFTPDAWEMEGQIVGSRSTNPSNPAAKMTLVSGFGSGMNEHSFQEVDFLRPGKPVKSGAYTLELLGVQHYTGLTARRDYGVPLVWLGFALLTLGIAVTFYFRPHTVAVGLKANDDGVAARLVAVEKGAPGNERWVIRQSPVLHALLGRKNEIDEE